MPGSCAGVPARPHAHLLAEEAAVGEQVRGVGGGGGAERRLRGVLVLRLPEAGGSALALGHVPAVRAGAGVRQLGSSPLGSSGRRHRTARSAGMHRPSHDRAGRRSRAQGRRGGSGPAPTARPRQREERTQRPCRGRESRWMQETGSAASEPLLPHAGTGTRLRLRERRMRPLARAGSLSRTPSEPHN